MNNQFTPRWNYETCKEAAALCETRFEFSKKHSRAYVVSLERGWINEFFPNSPSRNYKPDGYWNYETCKEAAGSCSGRGDFKSKCNRAYRLSREKGWLDDFYPKNLNKPPFYWTLERCREKALLCDTRFEFKKKFVSAYSSAQLNGWLDEICSHCVSLQLPDGTWSKEYIIEKSKEFTSLKEFREEHPAAFVAAQRLNIYEEISDIIGRSKRKNGYWTEENIWEAALECKTRNEFNSKFPSAVTTSKKLGIYDAVTQHMEVFAENALFYFYAIEFFKYNEVYVGLCTDFKSRKYSHTSISKNGLNFSSNIHVKRHILNFCKYRWVELEATVRPNEAKAQEQQYIDYYYNKGWTILNIAKPGSLGGKYLKQVF
ncbi:hypothetical protein [Rufibacter immobilis]|uniref:hypothetical protein n=1 Tax=Rufibacter immobilis TaxID=1348778 RepID=UPI0035E8093D